MMKRAVWLVIASVLLTAGLAGAQSPVYFADPNLQAAVEAQLSISDPNAADMLALTYLNAQSLGIFDLTGLEFASNLTELYLFNNEIGAISPLSGLTNLEILWLGVNQISDISAVSQLTNLQTLDLAGNQIIDISPVKQLTNLIWLYLPENQISEISPLSSLTNLDILMLAANPLNRRAHCVYLPLLETNNPGIYMSYDANPNPQTADCDGDCWVNFIDFGILASQWLQIACGQCEGAELTGDENVDIDDLSIMAESWLESSFKYGDLDDDNDVDLTDFAVFAAHWRDSNCGLCGGADLTADGDVRLDDLGEFVANWMAGVE
ncbi:MAG: leucine-rich repeat domain-containing protein [Planctomycetota bacterium]|jgi:hypothetical protein